MIFLSKRSSSGDDLRQQVDAALRDIDQQRTADQMEPGATTANASETLPANAGADDSAASDTIVGASNFFG
jgi:hypothetical protein